MAADAGLTSSSWARGPHHQWGPMQNQGDPERMQFSSEFEWISPSGRGLLTHYMPAHYSAGWWMDSVGDPRGGRNGDLRTVLVAEEGRADAQRAAAGRHRLHAAEQVGHRDSPRLERALHLAAVRVRAAAGVLRRRCGPSSTSGGSRPSPQTRDMNPIYTGKDVSYIDTKQANRDAENAVLDAERFAVFAGLLGGATYPQAALEKAWVQLAYGAHHDAITGSESDQVYLDLLTGWRDAWELGCAARDNALDADLQRRRRHGGGLEHVDAQADRRGDGATRRTTRRRCPGDRCRRKRVTRTRRARRSVGELAGARHPVAGLARLPPDRRLGADGLGSRAAAPRSATSRYRLRVDPARGGAVSSLTDGGRELLADGKVGNELAVYDEYPAHPDAGEGPWHLLPKGPVVVSSADAAESVQCYHSRAGRAAGGAGPNRLRAALHPDIDAVARRCARGLQHHDRRLHR